MEEIRWRGNEQAQETETCFSTPADWRRTDASETNIGTTRQEITMHYRNGREAKNGDKIVRLSGGKVEAFGVLHSAVPGNDYCNGNIAVVQSANEYACMCDCVHVDDLAEILAEKGLDKRPEGK
jgi:hypothetical protein